MAAGFVVHYGDTKTGKLYGTFPVSAGSYTQEISGAGDVKGTVSGPQVPVLWQVAKFAKKTMVAVEYRDDTIGLRRVVAAGPVVNPKPGVTTFDVGAQGIFTVFNSRRLFDETMTTGVLLNFTNLDNGSIIRGLASRAMSLVGGSLPVTLEASRSGIRSAIYVPWDLTMAGQKMIELAGQLPLTDFLFQPRFKVGDFTMVEWDLFTGTEAQPLLFGSQTWTLDATASGQQVVGDVIPDYDGSNLMTVAWVKGAGDQAAGIILPSVDSSLAAWPRLDGSDNSPALTAAQVQAQADGLLARNRRPKRSMQVQVDANWWYSRSTRPGDRVHLIADHYVLGRIDFTTRVLKEAGVFGSRWVTLTLADSVAEEWI